MMNYRVKRLPVGVVLLLVTVFSIPAFAQSHSESTIDNDVADLKQGLDTVWVLLAAFLVFFMQAGFGMVEA